MIKISLSMALTLYLLFFLGIIFVFWIRYEGRKHFGKKRREERENIWQCSICFYVYVDSRSKDLSRCPRCGSFNRRKE